MRYPIRYIAPAKMVMRYMEEHKTARSIELVNLGIDKSYLSTFIPLLIDDGCISRIRENGGYTYTFIKPFDINEEREKNEMQEFFYSFVSNSLKAYD